MRLDVGPVEAVWLTITITTFVLTVAAFMDARADRKAVTALNGRAREIAADGIVQQEGLATLIQIVLICIVVPQLFDDRVIGFSPGVVGLMLIPVLLLLKSVTRGITRRKLVGLIATDLKDANTTALRQLGAALQENTRITQNASDNAKVASDKADAAYHEANTINTKIADAQVAIITQGEAQALASESTARVEETTSDTRERVIDLQERKT